eukprot:Sspe_Gene.86756::Locus_57522_Transcript_1_4_Confidence_0.333_Length_2641::g.86756::m.86756/K01908/prpE; propionyl-CoA synthetase
MARLRMLQVTRRASHTATHRRSLSEMEGFWKEQSMGIEWDKPPSVIHSKDDVYDRWFQDGRLNICHNALDRHVANGFGDSQCLVYDSPVTGTMRTYTYRESLEAVQEIAAMFRRMGCEKGDCILIYMPMVPEAVFAMLAAARLGCVHCVVFGGFAPRELAKRIKASQPKLIVSASCGLPDMTKVVNYKELLDAAMDSLGCTTPCIILQRDQLRAALVRGRDHEWHDTLSRGVGTVDPVIVEATHPLYLLYTSGTTGAPKGVVRDTGGYATVLNWSMPSVFGLDRGDCMFTASDIGWVVGHSYIVYAPLLRGCKSILYEGKPVGTPDAGVYWRVISEHQANVMFVAPTAMRAVKREDPSRKLLKGKDISCLRHLFVAGERTDRDTLHWLQDAVKRPVIDHWWQTETGWPMTAVCVGLDGPDAEIAEGSAGRPVPGYNVKVLDTDGNEIEKATEMGQIVVKQPLPPGMLHSIQGSPDAFKEMYLSTFPGCYLTGDSGYIDEKGFVYILSRSDDILNVSSIRISTGTMEEIVGSHPKVAETAVVGQKDSYRGEVPVALCVLKAEEEVKNDVLLSELQSMVASELGKFAAVKAVICVPRLPKTRSGKILRKILRKMLNGEEWEDPGTIEDLAVLDQCKECIAAFLNQSHKSATSS